MDKNYSTILQSKLPAYIVEDPQYTNFISFFEEYYNWFNDTYNLTNFSDTIDIDSDYDSFLQYYQADFLPYFPHHIATDKIKLLKIVKELYKAKGIGDSFKFLFKALYDSYSEVTPTRDFVFKASDGKWVVPKSIKIKSLDPRFLNINNYIIFGIQSKTFGIVEFAKINGKFTQIYLSNIERLYYSGEEIKVLDRNNKEIYFVNGHPVEYQKLENLPVNAESLSAKIIGALSGITIDSDRRGQFYSVGDPVVILGGLNPESENPIAATAEISAVTLGAINNATVTNGGIGYNIFPDSSVDVLYNGQIDTVANVVVSLVDTSKPSGIYKLPVDSIAQNYSVNLYSNVYNFSVNANINSTLANTFSFLNFTTYPISDLTIKDGGGGYTSPPSLNINSLVHDTSNNNQIIESFGILAPIQILNGGINYTANDSISINGGDGDFVFARISSLSANGTITGVEYFSSNNTPYVVGGMGYKNSNLPSVSISSNTGSNASLIVPRIMGTGVEYTLETEKIGSITQIKLIENGEDYISTPNVFLRIQDIAVSNVLNATILNTAVYQGSSYNQATFSGYPESFSKISDESVGFSDDIYRIRVYNYKGTFSPNQNLKLYDIISSVDLDEYTITSTPIGGLDLGNKIYGDGTASATAKFLNGLIIGDGTYLNADGQPSAFSILQSDIYNSSTYFLSSEVSYDEYKEPILNLVHPISSRIVPRNLLRSNTNISQNTQSNVNLGIRSQNNFTITLLPGNTNYSNTYTVSSNISELSVDTILSIMSNNYMNVYSKILKIDQTNSILILSDYIQYKYSNVYSGIANANSVIIQQDATNEIYSVNTFVVVGDYITVKGNNYPVIDKIDNILYFSSNNNIQLISNTANSQLITVIKPLSTNNVIKYLSV
jgi:hypothetical protein